MKWAKPFCKSCTWTAVHNRISVQISFGGTFDANEMIKSPYCLMKLAQFLLTVFGSFSQICLTVASISSIFFLSVSSFSKWVITSSHMTHWGSLPTDTSVFATFSTSFAMQKANATQISFGVTFLIMALMMNSEFFFTTRMHFWRSFSLGSDSQACSSTSSIWAWNWFG